MEFRVLGPLDVRADGVSLPTGSPRQRALLAALLLHPNQVVTTDRLIDVVWGETAPRSAVANLRTHVVALRKRLAPADSRLVAGAGGYRITVHQGELDLCCFDELVEQARQARASGEHAIAAKQFGAALALWRGRPFDNVALHGVAEAEVARLSEARLTVTEDCLRARLQVGEPDMIGDLRGLVVEHPLREPLWALLMLALHHAGRKADALAAFDEAKELLATELGLDPGQELRELRQQILTGDPLPRPEPTMRVAVPANLPPAIADFTGRSGQLRELDTLLADSGDTPAAVVITGITGSAGVGKTAFAVYWAHRVRDRFPDGQLYLNLLGYVPGSVPLSPTQALARFLGALGVPPERIPEDVTEASGLFRSLLADRRMLVVLDNASSPDQVRPLLPASTGCLVVITSRDRLDGLVAKDGARLQRLDVLPKAEAVSLLARILGPRMVAKEPEAAAELASICACLPLALRIAAAHVAGQPNRSLAEHVSELRRNDPLVSLAIDGDDHAAVRVAFDLSYAALEPDARHLFRTLGLAPGPDISTRAAAELAGLAPTETARLLARLTRAHLIDQPVSGRYTFHDLLRSYARHRAGEDDRQDREAAVDRLLTYYLRYGGAAADVITPHMSRLTASGLAPLPPEDRFTTTVGALAWLDAEQVNLIAAIHDCHQHGRNAMTWQLAGVLRGHLHQRGAFLEWCGVAEAAVAAADKEDQAIPRAAARLLLGTAHGNLNRYPEAVEHHTLALNLSRAAGWLPGEIGALVALGGIDEVQGRPAVAADRVRSALELGRESVEPATTMATLIKLGIVETTLGRLAAAGHHLTRALALSRELAAPKAEGFALACLGTVFRLQGRFAPAVEYLQRALALFREVEAPYCESVVHVELAHILCDTGVTAEALDRIDTGLTIARDTGDRRVENVARLAAAATHVRAGRYHDASAEYECALRLATELGLHHLRCQALAGLAAVDQDGDRAHHALRLSRDAEYRILEGQLHTLLASIAHRSHDAETATRHAEHALALHRSTGHRLGAAHAHHFLGAALLDTAGKPSALSHLRAAHALFTEIGTPEAAQVSELLQH